MVQPFALGPAVGAALDAPSTPVQLVVATIAWAAWTLGVVAVLVPRTIGLTFVRLVAPACLGLAGWAALAGDDLDTVAVVAALVAGAIVALVALAPSTGDVFVNGSAYGAERRFALRPPAAVVFGPVEVLWIVIVAATLSGPLLLATEQWAAGVVVCAIGVGVVLFGTRSLHQLSRRWLVMVPAGVVLHDPTVVTAHLVQRSAIRSIGPAPADSGALDLTGGALGLALELQLTEAATLELRSRRSAPTVVHATGVLFTPSLPGAVLREAAARRLPVA